MGKTGSQNFPTLGAFQPDHGGSTTDAFVAVLQANGSLHLATFLGGSNFEEAAGVAVTTDGDIVVAGTTGSRDFPIVQPVVPRRDIVGAAVFLSRFSADGASLRTSSVLGAGEAFDAAWQAGQAFVAGRTSDPQFPVRHAYQGERRGGSDAFVTRIAETNGPYLPLIFR